MSSITIFAACFSTEFGISIYSFPLLHISSNLIDLNLIGFHGRLNDASDETSFLHFGYSY